VSGWKSERDKWRVAVVQGEESFFDFKRSPFAVSPHVTVREMKDAPGFIEEIRSWEPDLILVSASAALRGEIPLVSVLRNLTSARVVVDVTARDLEPRALQIHVFDQLVYEPTRRILRRGDRTARLSPTEGRLLEFLMENPERVVREEELIAHAWRGKNCNAGNLRTQLHNLRRKVDAEGETRLLHTVMESGYALSRALADANAQQAVPKNHVVRGANSTEIFRRYGESTLQPLD